MSTFNPWPSPNKEDESTEALDAHCQRLEIPAHLHTLGRQAFAVPTGTPLYRRFKQMHAEDLTMAIKFDEKENSVNRGDLSKPVDVLLDCQSGGQRPPEWGVFQIDSTAIALAQWEDSAKGNIKWTLEANHSPDRCNYAHCVIQAVKDGVKVPKITAKTARLKIREILRPFLKQVIPPPVAVLCLPTEALPHPAITPEATSPSASNPTTGFERPEGLSLGEVIFSRRFTGPED